MHDQHPTDDGQLPDATIPGENWRDGWSAVAVGRTTTPERCTHERGAIYHACQRACRASDEPFAPNGFNSGEGFNSWNAEGAEETATTDRVVNFLDEWQKKNNVA